MVYLTIHTLFGLLCLSLFLVEFCELDKIHNGTIMFNCGLVASYLSRVDRGSC